MHLEQLVVQLGRLRLALGPLADPVADQGADPLGHRFGPADRHRRREVLRQERPAAGDDGRVLQGVAQLADVAGPGSRSQVRDRLLGDSRVGSEPAQEVLRQQRDVVRPVAQGGRWIWKTFSRKNRSWRNWPAATCREQVRVRRRQDADVDLRRRRRRRPARPPGAPARAAASPAPAAGCRRVRRGRRCRRRPARAGPAAPASAPVNAPLTWPNSSLSTRFGLSAATWTGRNGRSLRAECRWTARATSSLPVPLSPVMSTQASVGATRAMRLNTACIAGLRPTSSSPIGLERRGRLLDRPGPAGERPGDRVERLVQVERLGQVVERPALDGPHRGGQVAEGGDDDDRRVAR